MLFVLLVICVVLYVVACDVSDKSEGTAIILFITSVVGAIVVAVALFCNVNAIVNGRVLDDKIDMYLAENTLIECQIDDIVEGFQNFEKETHQNLTSGSPITLMTLYPELKSNEIVTKQIELYIGNNSIIKELNEQKINLGINKWWLYFGS